MCQMFNGFNLPELVPTVLVYKEQRFLTEM